MDLEKTIYHLPKDYYKDYSNYNSFEVSSKTIGYNSIDRLVKVYRPELFVILTEKELIVQLSETETDKINGIKFRPSFIDGFNDGYNMIKDKYQDILSIHKVHIDDIKENYFNILHENKFKGWNAVRKMFPRIISHDIIRQYGYYSGIVARIDEMINEYPTAFKNFRQVEDAGYQKSATQNNYRHVFTDIGFRVFNQCIEAHSDDLTIQSVTNWCAIFYGLSFLEMLSNTAKLTDYLKELPDLTNNSEMFFLKGKTNNEIAKSTLDKWENRLNGIARIQNRETNP